MHRISMSGGTKVLYRTLGVSGSCVLQWGSCAGDQYRAKALEFLAHAETENNLAMRRDLEMMAAAYLRLAEQAERNQNFAIEVGRPGNESDPEPEP